MTESYPLEPARSAPVRIPAGDRPPDAARPIQVIAVTSGKGGVGKTTVAINLSAAIASLGKSVTLMDADLGLANVDVMLGLKPALNLSHVLDGLCSLEDVVVTGPGGIHLVPAASGLRRMTTLSKAEHAGLVYAFSGLSDITDVLIIDTGPPACRIRSRRFAVPHRRSSWSS
ncbi:MAG: AAA family ATPase [Beggiatoa sp.]|nr:AAA family ATPase [Beggiatoa sp.]